MSALRAQLGVLEEELARERSAGEELHSQLAALQDSSNKLNMQLHQCQQKVASNKIS